MVVNVEKYVRLKTLREERNLTQRQAADFLKCGEALYAKYERGERAVPVDIFIRLALIYNTSVDYILGRTDVKTPYRSAPKLNTPYQQDGTTL